MPLLSQTESQKAEIVRRIEHYVQNEDSGAQTALQAVHDALLKPFEHENADERKERTEAVVRLKGLIAWIKKTDL